MIDTAKAPATTPPRREIILVVDDSAEMRFSHRRQLERHGYQVWEAATGVGALELAASGPDLVLLDITLHDIDGIEVCRRLRANPLTRSIPVVQYSHVAFDLAAQTTGLDMGADAYLADPEPVLVVATIASVLRRRSAESDVRLLAALGAALDKAPTVTQRLAAVRDVLIPARADRCSVDLYSSSMSGSDFPESDERDHEWVVPLIARGTTIGVLRLSGPGERPYSEHDRPWLNAIADRIALSLDNARLLERAHREADRQRQLREFATSLAAAMTREEVAFAVALRGSDSIDASFSNIAIANSAGDLEIIHGPGLADEIAADWLLVRRDDRTPLSDATRSNTPVLLSSLEAVAEWYPSLYDATIEAGLESTASIPIVSADGSALGAVGFAWSHPTIFTDDLVAHLQVLASITAQAVERSIAYEAEQRTKRRLNALRVLLSRMSEALTAEQVARAFVEELTKLQLVDRAIIMLRTDPPLVRSSDRHQSDPSPVDTTEQEAMDAAASSRQEVRGLPLSAADELAARPFVALPLLFDDSMSGAFGAQLIGDDIDHETITLLRASALLAVHALRRAMAYDRANHTAQHLQLSLLPQALPMHSTVELGAEYRPAGQVDRVGGDWYDAIVLDDHRIALVIGDVAGHGVRSAALMGKLRHSAAALATVDHTPQSLVRAVERVMRTGAIEMATMLYLVIDTRSGETTWCSAGHLPPLVRRANGTTEAIRGGLRPPLGVPLRTHNHIDAASIILRPGDCIALFTDGLVERRGELITDGLERLREHFAGLPEVRLTRLDTDIVTPLVGAHPEDDVAILVCRLAERP